MQHAPQRMAARLQAPTRPCMQCLRGTSQGGECIVAMHLVIVAVALSCRPAWLGIQEGYTHLAPSHVAANKRAICISVTQAGDKRKHTVHRENSCVTPH